MERCHAPDAKNKVWSCFKCGTSNTFLMSLSMVAGPSTMLAQPSAVVERSPAGATNRSPSTVGTAVSERVPARATLTHACVGTAHIL